MHQTKTTIHTPVLLDAVLDMAAPAAGESYLDLTAGYGGHASAIIGLTGAADRAVLVDRDETAIAALQPLAEQGATLLHTDFLSATRQLASQSKKFDVVLADLGVSSLHLDKGERGFSFSQNGPLDMRMDQRSELTAAMIVNTYGAAELEDILRRYGEEWRAKSVVAAIVAGRSFHDTASLAAAIKQALPGKPGKIHPATKSFQALRIAVNDELGQLETALPLWLELLNPGGRLLIISFHSLEDRIVKQVLADVSGDRYDAEFQLLAKRPITADSTELASNPRSRSAKLRGVAKINKNPSTHKAAKDKGKGK